ncbi:MAG: uracil-DNA glycosylase [Patescibacteria group bacterium]|nr:uracil-DNA glycosylase [Patescibacteria group bacterium]
MPTKEALFKDFETRVKQCTKCGLSKGRIHVVPGEGSINAEIMFIGEGPGKNEDEQGRPFVGAAGKVLTELIKSIGLTRQEIYIANVVKCRPPSNRDPLPAEIETCWPWLEKQIFMIKPKLIIPLGRHSLGRFLPNAKISRDHGRALRKNIKATTNIVAESEYRVVFFPCYHPAAALYNGSLRDVLKKDFKKIPKVLEVIEKEKEKKPTKPHITTGEENTLQDKKENGEEQQLQLF